MPDEQVVIDLVVRAADAIDTAQKFQEAIEQNVTAIKQIAQESGVSFKAASEGLKSMIREAKAADESIQKLTQEIADLQTTQAAVGKKQFAGTPEGSRLADLQGELKAAIEPYARQLQAIPQAMADVRKQAQETIKLDIPFPVDRLKADIKSIAEQANVSFKQAAEQMKQAFATARQVTKPDGGMAWVSPQAKAEFDAYSKSVGQGLKQLQAETTTTKSSFSGLQAVVMGLAAALGISLVGALKSVITYLVGATKEAYSFAKSFYALNVGINALRRSGVDITMKDMLQNLTALKQEFKVFSEKELVAGSAQLINLSRDFGFTKEQIFELQRTISTLAIVNGRAMDDVQRTVALALSSGYTEGLQRLGVSMNRVTIAAKAQEMGFDGNYTALTEQERALATLAQIEEKTAKYANDLAGYYQTLPGQVDTATAALTDFEVELGNVFLPARAAAIVGIANAVKGLWDALRILALGVATVWSNAAAVFVLVAKNAQMAWDAIRGRGGIDPLKAFQEAMAVRQSIMQQFATAIGEKEQYAGVPEAPIAPVEETRSEEEQDRVGKATAELIDLREEYAAKLVDIQQKLDDDLQDIDEEHIDKNVALWQSWQDEIVSINDKAKQKIEDANRDLNYSIQDLNRETAQKIEDANRKQREQELKAERNYQEKLRKLREEFLFDLEDALRERDALQVLRLIRRYKLDVEQLQRQNEQEKQERAEANREELAEIQRQRERKLEELRIEHQRRLAEIELQRTREQEDAQRKYEEEIAAELEAWNEKREQRLAQFEQAKQDLSSWLQEQLTELTTKYVEMEGASTDFANTITQIFASVFGPGGTADANLQYFMGILDAAVAQAMARKAEIDAITSSIAAASATTSQDSTGGGTAIANPNPLAHASGGSFVTTRPKMFMAGEVPELISVTPLNQLGNNGGGGGRTKVEIMLSPDLEGRIVENTLNQAADVLIETLRR